MSATCPDDTSRVPARSIMPTYSEPFGQLGFATLWPWNTSRRRMRWSPLPRCEHWPVERTAWAQLICAGPFYRRLSAFIGGQCGFCGSDEEPRTKLAADERG